VTRAGNTVGNAVGNIVGNTAREPRPQRRHNPLRLQKSATLSV